MKIFFNGEARTVNNAMLLTDLLAEMDLQNKRIAVEVNQEIIPRSQHETYQLNSDDRVEVVQAIGGG